MTQATLNIEHGNWSKGQTGKVKRFRRRTVDENGKEFTSDYMFYPDNVPTYGFLVTKSEIKI